MRSESSRTHMFKKIISVLTAAILAIGFSITTATPSSATSFASNSGAASTEVEVRISVDSNGFFTIPANASRFYVTNSFTLNGQNAATFSGETFAVNVELKNPSGTVVTDELVRAITPNADFFGYVNWNSTGLSGYTLNSPVTLRSNNTVLNGNANAQIQTYDGTALPTGAYQVSTQLLKGGTAYTFANNDTVSSYAYVTLSGTSSTIPSNLSNNALPRLSVATCINRSLVTSSDTLTLHPVVTSTGNITSQATRFFQGGSMGQSTLLSNTSTLSLASVDLTKPISVALSAILDSTTGVVSSADLSVTKGDGTEVTQNCTPATPAAPTVSFSSSTNLRATFTVSSVDAMPRCALYLASDLNTAIRETGGMPDSSRVVTCNFSGRTADVNYVVKVQEYFDFYYFENSQQNNSYFSVYRSYASSLSQASSTISTAGVQSNNNNQQTEEQIAAAAAAAAQAAAIEAERLRQVAIAAAKVALQGVLTSDKPGTLAQYKEADYAISSEEVLTRVNAALLKLSAEDRVKSEEINKVIKVESFIVQISTAETQKTVTSAKLVSFGLLVATNPNKAGLTYALKRRPASTLDSLEKIAAAIVEETAVIKARTERLAAGKARIAKLALGASGV